LTFDLSSSTNCSHGTTLGLFATRVLIKSL